MRPRSGLLAGASNAAAAGLSAAASLGLMVYVARHAGLRLLGEYAVIGTVWSVFGVVDAARTQDLTTRFAAGGGNESRRLRWQLAVGGLVIAAAGAVGYGALTEARAAEGAAIAWAGAVVQIMTAEVVAATQVRHRFQRLAIAITAGAVVGSGVAALLLARFGLVALGIGLATTSVLSRLLLLADPDIRATIAAGRLPEVKLPSQSLSLVLLGGAAQLVNVTDAISIRSIASAAQVGVYRAGSQIPTLLVGLLYRGYDTLMPRLAAASETEAAAMIRRTAPKLSVVVGAALGLVIGLRNPLVRVVLGHANHDAETVLWLFGVVWIINGVVHPAALLLIARRRQQRIVRLVLFEYLANLVLTLALIPSLGAIGSAVATLATLAVSNLVLLPGRLARDLPSLAIRRHLLLDCFLPSAVTAGVVVAACAVAGA